MRLFEITRASVLFSSENLLRSSLHHIFKSQTFRFPFSYKNSLTWGVKSEKYNLYNPLLYGSILHFPPPPSPEYHTHRLHVTNLYTLFSSTYGQIRECELILRMCYFFRKCLGDCNIECWLQCISSFSDCVSVTKFVHAHAFRCVIGIHAWRAGRLLLGLRKFKLIYIFLTIKGIGTSFWFNNIWGCLGRPELVMIG